MRRTANFLVAMLAVLAVARLAECQSSYWCDGGEQQERLYRSLNALRYSDDFKEWSNSTGWAATVHTCEEVPAGQQLFANCTALPDEADEGLYECAGTGVSIETRAALAVYPCQEAEVEGVTFYNCTVFEQQCNVTVVSSGDHLCPCQWYGVDCDSAEERVVLDLSDNNVDIMLPDLFYDDIYVSIDLSKNLIYGALSEQVANLGAIIALDLSKNNFQGLPPAGLGDLSALTELSIKSNYFAGLYPDYLVTPEDFWPDMDLSDLHFSDNMFWCPAPGWCITEYDECESCEDIPSQDGCVEESEYACDHAVACCYVESWSDSCEAIATDAGAVCTSPGFNWLLLFVCIGVVIVIIFIGAIVAMLLTRRGQNFLVMFTRNKKNLIVTDDEPDNDTGLYDIYPDEY